MNPRSLIDKQIRANRKWLRASQQIVDRELEYLDQDLTEASLESLVCVADSLGTLGTFYGTQGPIAIVDGDRNGWVNVHKAALHHLWALRIRCTVFSKRAFVRQVADVPKLTNYTSISGCLLCYSTVMELDEWQSYTQSAMLAMATIPGAVSGPFWSERIFEPFVLRLHQNVMRVDVPESLMSRPLGVYDEVLANWDDGSALSQSLVEMCDYHCRNMDDTGADWDPEFKHPPFDLVPCDFLAVQSIRKLLGLDAPRIDHPLVSTGLADVDRDEIGSEDAIIDRVATVYFDLFQPT